MVEVIFSILKISSLIKGLIEKSKKNSSNNKIFELDSGNFNLNGFDPIKREFKNRFTGKTFKMKKGLKMKRKKINLKFRVNAKKTADSLKSGGKEVSTVLNKVKNKNKVNRKIKKMDW